MPGARGILPPYPPPPLVAALTTTNNTRSYSQIAAGKYASVFYVHRTSENKYSHICEWRPTNGDFPRPLPTKVN